MRYLPQISRTFSEDLGSPTACGARPEGFVMAAYEKNKIQGKGWKSLKPKIFGHSLFFYPQKYEDSPAIFGRRFKQFHQEPGVKQSNIWVFQLRNWDTTGHDQVIEKPVLPSPNFGTKSSRVGISATQGFVSISIPQIQRIHF